MLRLIKQRSELKAAAKYSCKTYWKKRKIMLAIRNALRTSNLQGENITSKKFWKHQIWFYNIKSGITEVPLSDTASSRLDGCAETPAPRRPIKRKLLHEVCHKSDMEPWFPFGSVDWCYVSGCALRDNCVYAFITAFSCSGHYDFCRGMPGLPSIWLPSHRDVTSSVRLPFVCCLLLCYHRLFFVADADLTS